MNKSRTSDEQIVNNFGTLTEQIKILKRFRNNMEKRTKLETIIPCDRISDPLISALEISSGNI